MAFSLGPGGGGSIAGSFGYKIAPYRWKPEPYNAPVNPAPVPISQAPITVGIEPQAYAAILYGKEKPLFVGGKALLGSRLIEGPVYSGAAGEPLVTAVYYVAEAANPTGTRDITEFRIRGERATYNAGTGILDDPKYAGARVEFRTGTRDQLPFQQSIDRDGSNAIAYRQGILISLENMPLRPFNGIIPFLGCEVSDSSFGDPDDGITRNDALGVILRYSRLDNNEFEVSVPGADQAWILGGKTSLLTFLQQMRELFTHWNITYSDKLRIIDPSNFIISAEITNDNHVRETMKFTKADPLLVPRRMNYTYIDVDRDYEPNVVSAQEDLYPSPSTSSVDETNIELPIVTTAAQATADINVSLYETIAVRQQMQTQLLPPLFGVEPGDVTRYADHYCINSVYRVLETQHDFEMWQVDVSCGEVLNCGASARRVEATLYLAPFWDLANTFAPIIPAELPDSADLPVITGQHTSAMAIAEGLRSDDGEVQDFTHQPSHITGYAQSHGDWKHVFVDDTYVYYVDGFKGFSFETEASIIRVRLDDPSAIDGFEWSTRQDNKGVGGVVGACMHAGKIWLGLYNGAFIDPYFVIIDLADFSLDGITTAGGLSSQALVTSMVGAGAYVYASVLYQSGPDAGLMYIHRLEVDSPGDFLTIVPPDKLSNMCYDAATNKIFLAPQGNGGIFTYPAYNDRMAGVLDLNVTFNLGALSYFDLTQDTDIDCGVQIGFEPNVKPWIVDDTVRFITIVKDTYERPHISSYDTTDYTVARASYDISDILGFGRGWPGSIVVSGDYTYLNCPHDLSQGIKILKVRNNFLTYELLTSE